MGVMGRFEQSGVSISQSERFNASLKLMPMDPEFKSQLTELDGELPDNTRCLAGVFWCDV